MSTLGKNIKMLRQSMNMSQFTLASKLHTTQQRVSEWERDKIEPSLYNVIAIMRIFDIKFEELIEDIDFSVEMKKGKAKNRE